MMITNDSAAMKELRPFLDEKGRLAALPAKHRKKLPASPSRAESGAAVPIPAAPPHYGSVCGASLSPLSGK